MRKLVTMRSKLGILTALMLTGGTLLSSCGWTDVRLNLIAGTLAAVRGVATDWVAAFFPPAPTVYP